MQRDQFIVGGCIWINNCEPCIVFQIHWNSCHLSQEEIVFLQNLFITSVVPVDELLLLGERCFHDGCY